MPSIQQDSPLDTFLQRLKRNTDKHTTGRLYNSKKNSFCIIGLMYQHYHEYHPTTTQWRGECLHTILLELIIPATTVLSWLSLPNDYYPLSQGTLIELNDANFYTFPEFATYIEQEYLKHVGRLFTPITPTSYSHSSSPVEKYYIDEL